VEQVCRAHHVPAPGHHIASTHTADEQAQIESHFAEFKDIQASLDELDNATPGSRRIAEPTMPGHKPGDFASKRQPGSIMFKNMSTGEPIRGYRPGEMMSSDDAPVGDVLRGILLNDFSELPHNIQASLAGGSDTGGGYMLNPTLSTRFIDLARSASVVTRAGATTIPVPSNELHIAKLDTDPTAYWRPETGAITASKPTFGRITLRPKVVAAIVPVSVELLEDSANAGSAIETAIMGALGSALDTAALKGAGAASEPLGVVNDGNCNTIASVGTPTTYANISAAVADILTANYDGDIGSLSWIMHPVQGETYDNLVTGITNDNTPLQPTGWVSQLQRYITTTLSLNSGNSPNNYEMVVGDFSQMVIGTRNGGVRVGVLDQGTVTDSNSDTWNASTQLLRHIRAYMRVDVALLRPTWFTVLSGVTA
jgi:HK97 family phage major capsid protein